VRLRLSPKLTHFGSKEPAVLDPVSVIVGVAVGFLFAALLWKR
jgi:hypothetical protein